MNVIPAKIDREHSVDLVDRVSESYFTVTMQYTQVHDEISIESYELEGDNISREELIERFGEDQVRKLEEM